MPNTIEIMCKTIVDAIKFHIDKATFNRDYQGRITNVLANDRYVVAIYGNEYTTYSACGLKFKVNDSVWLTAPQNDFDSIYISGKRQ